MRKQRKVMRIASQAIAPAEARAATTRVMEILRVWQRNVRILESTASMLVVVSRPPTRLIVLPPVAGTRHAPRDISVMNTRLTPVSLL